MFEEDQGANFGTWKDKTSELIYKKTVQLIGEHIHPSEYVVDLGGGTGIVGETLGIPEENYTVFDIDESKKRYGNFVCGDITKDPFPSGDVGVLRFVVHYMKDDPFRDLMKNFRKSDLKRLIFIQFFSVGESLSIKKRISNFYEPTLKYFRGVSRMHKLIEHESTEFITEKNIGEYMVTSEFYSNRFGKKLETTPHTENIYFTVIEKKEG